MPSCDVAQVLCVAIGCCYFIARRRRDMKVCMQLISSCNVVSAGLWATSLTFSQGLQFAQFDDSSDQPGTSFAIPARDLKLIRYFHMHFIKCIYFSLLKY